MKMAMRYFIGTPFIVVGLLILLASPVDTALSVSSGVKGCAENGDISAGEENGSAPSAVTVGASPNPVKAYGVTVASAGGGSDCDIDESATGCAMPSCSDSACGINYINWDKDYDWSIDKGAVVNTSTSSHLYGGTWWVLTVGKDIQAPAAGFVKITITVNRQPESLDGDGTPTEGEEEVTEATGCLSA